MLIRSRTLRLLATGLVFVSRLAVAEPPMIFQHLGTPEGLPQNTVMQTLQDSQGFIWIATEDGLVRYDGYEARRYAQAPGRSDSLASDYVWSMAEDRHGDLWLALKDAGLARWNRRTDTFTSFRHDPGSPSGLSSDILRALLIDRRGHIWIGTTGGGLNEFNPATATFVHYGHDAARADSLSSDVVTSLWEEPSGQIWIGTDDGLNRLVAASGTFRQYHSERGSPRTLSSNRIATIRTDARNRLWIGTFDGGLDLFDPAADAFTSYRAAAGDAGSLPNDEVRGVLEDRDGRLWVGTAGGLALRDERTGRFTRYLHDASDATTLRDDYVMSLFQDRSGLVWVGTRAGGVSRWNPRTWSLGHRQPAGLGGAYVNAFADDLAGRLWVGTLGKGLGRFDPASGAWVTLASLTGSQHRLADARVMALASDRHGDLWIGTMSGGLSRLGAAGRLDTWRAAKEDPGALAADGVMALLEHSGGRIWVGTFGGGVNILDPASGRFQRVLHDPHNAASLSSPRATALAEDRDGNVWVGTDGGGLNLLRPDGSVAAVFRHRTDDVASLAGNTVYSLHVDERGRVWVGTASGLGLAIGSTAKPESIRFKNLSQRDGLTSDAIYGIEPDAHGGLWLSGNAGLVRYDPATGEMRPFHREHGLQGDEFVFGAHHHTRGGLLAFGGPNGFNLFDPAQVTERSAPPMVALTNVEILNKPARTAVPYPLLDRLELGYRDTVASFEFAALDFAAPAKNRYAYRLRGFDPEWIVLRQRRPVSYTNLDPGRYVFEVRAANSDGAWSRTAISLPIVVAPAPWRSWWAYALYAAAACLLLYTWSRSQRGKLAQAAAARTRLEAEVAARTSELRERNTELDRLNRVKNDFLARMSHEIRTPMNGIIGMGELLMRAGLSPQQERMARTVNESAKSLMEILNDTLDLAKIEAGRLTLESASFDLAAVMTETAELFAPQAHGKGLELVVAPAPDLDCLVVGDALRVRQVLLNLVGNAVKFTAAGEIALTADLADRSADRAIVSISVRDSGIGMPADVVARIFDPFTQGDESTTRRFGGTGLGLAICRELVALMHGTVTATSEPDVGSTFTVRLPLSLGAAPPACRASYSRSTLIVTRRATLADAVERQCRLLNAACRWVHPDQATTSIAAHVEPGQDSVIVDVDSCPGEAEQLIAVCHEARYAQRVVLLGTSAALAGLDLPSRAPAARTASKPLGPLGLREALTMAGGESARAPAARTGGIGRLRGNVLIVEDNAVNAAVFEGLLDEIGCSHTTVTGGREAVALASGHLYGAILMDVHMPDMDGWTATGLIRRAEAGQRRTPIIALTADAGETHRQRCLAADMDGFLSKPLALEDLHAMLARWLPAAPAEAPGPAKAGSLSKETLSRIMELERGGRGGFLKRVARIFIDTSGRQIDAILAAVASGDLATARAQCHSLKSAAAHVGADALARLAVELERAAIAKDAARAAFLAEGLRAAGDAAANALQTESMERTA
jgi:signal transduction histidine kinase/ligand-binding sensor domain-containing protein/FixJ family two-component response regulator